MKRKTSFLAKASLMLFAVLFSFLGARAQKALPYEYGFETALADEGWELQGATSTYTGIFMSSTDAHTGSYLFRFNYSEQKAYLVSPVLSGTDAGVTVSFYYKEYNSTYGDEQFQVGFTTDESVTDASAFTFGDVVTASLDWQQYEETFPAGTKRIAIKYIYTNAYYLWLDDFYFEAVGAVARPTGLTVNYTGGTEATVSWTSTESAWDIDVNGTVTEVLTNPCTLTGLDYATTYKVKVRAKKGTDVSDWTNPVSFTTDISDDMCQIKLVLSDTYGDGWNGGAALKIVDVLTNIEIGSYTVTNAAGKEAQTIIVSVPNAREIQFIWVAGSYDGECVYAAYDVNGEEIFSGSGAMSAPVTYTVDCKVNPWKAPSDLAASEITATSAKLSWTENSNPPAYAWIVAFKADGDTDFDFEGAKENPFVLENLKPETTYTVKVRPDTDEAEKWSAEINFTTVELYAKPTDLAVSEIGTTTAKLSWTENGTATEWEICLNDDETNLIEAGKNPFALEKLTPETEYAVKVRSVYGKEHSGWSAATSFTTGVAFFAPTDVAASNVTATSADVSWTGTADSYNLRYRTAKETVIFSDDFESGMDQWTIVRNGEGTDNTDWRQFNGAFSGNTIPAHSGEYFAMSRSWSGSAYNVDNWLISPAVELGGTMSYWVYDDGSYHEHYDIYVSTTTNDLDAFTLLYEPGNASSTWTEHTVDLSAYAGQTGYIAFRHTDSDQDFLFVDDVTITGFIGDGDWVTVNNVTSPYNLEGLSETTSYLVEVQGVYTGGESKWAGTAFTTLEGVPTPSALAAADVTWGTAQLSWTENGEATAWEICLNDDETNLIAADSNPFTVTGLTPETDYTAKVRAVKGEKKSHWSNEASFTTDIRFYAPTDVVAANVTTTSAEISWNAEAAATGAVLEYANAGSASFGFTEYKYDNGTNASSVGLGGSAFSWGVMFPAGSYEGNTLNKVSVFDVAAMTGSVSIYSGGDTAPGTEIATQPITLTGAGAFVDVSFGGLAIDATQNLWVIVNNESGAGYPAATATDDLGDANGRWVEISGNWYDLANAGVTGSCFMVRAEIGTAIDPSILSWTTVSDVTSPYELTGLTQETTYAVRVKSVFADGESKWTYTSFATLSENPVPSNIAIDLAADGATLTWDGTGESYNVQYRTPESEDPLFEADFSNGWTIYTEGDAAGAWTLSSGSMIAHSWTSSTGALDADNWLISPAVELGGMLKFKVGVEDAYADSYEVLLSTTGIDIADFTTELQAMAAGTNGQVVSIDLSAYAGQTGYIAIHHVSSDMNYLAISNLGIYEPVPAGAWESMAVTGTTATISGLATNNLYEYQIQSVKGANVSEWSKAEEFALITLANDADNTSLINKFDGKFAHVTLANRTLYKDGEWNTICLPFDMTLAEVAASPLADADVRTLTSSITVEDKSVTLNFTAEGEALTTWGGNQYHGGVPYIVKWASGSDIVNPEFANVTITSSTYYVGDDTKAEFWGTYAPISFSAEDKSILFIGAGNKLNWPLAGATIGACRGYFQLIGMEAEVNPNAVKIYTNLDDEDPTGIGSIDNEQLTIDNDADWYDLSGRKLGSKPSMKGIFIVNGKKVLK